MPCIGLTASTQRAAHLYVEALKPWGVEPWVLIPPFSQKIEGVMDQLDGLLVTGSADIHPSHYGQNPDSPERLSLNQAQGRIELLLIRGAMERDIPVLGICRGLQSINVAAGGSFLQDIPNHRATCCDGICVAARHRIWISPGSKLAATIGAGGQVRVNSLHHQGIREAQKSPDLIASAYSLEDAIIEGLESPSHTWVVAVQCRPERQDEVPRQFQRLFQELVSRARDTE